jgi:mannose-6-phosphate isomerase-like protein (cupin superfamily)
MDIRPVRVVVTGNDPDGKARVTSDEAAGDVFHREHRPVALTDLWQIPSVPAPIDSDGRQALTEPFTLAPDRGGVKLRVVQFDPEPAHTGSRADGQDVFAEMGAGGEHVAEARHPFMHRTETVDFGLVLEGSITMLLDHEDVEVSAGDVVIQRGTNHAWSNRGTEPCLIAFVLVDAATAGATPQVPPR